MEFGIAGADQQYAHGEGSEKREAAAEADAEDNYESSEDYGKMVILARSVVHRERTCERKNSPFQGYVYVPP